MHHTGGRLALGHRRAGHSQNISTTACDVVERYRNHTSGQKLRYYSCTFVSPELSYLCGWSRRCTLDTALKPADRLCSTASRWSRPTPGYSHLLQKNNGKQLFEGIVSTDVCALCGRGRGPGARGVRRPLSKSLCLTWLLLHRNFSLERHMAQSEERMIQFYLPWSFDIEYLIPTDLIIFVLYIVLFK